MNTMRLCWKGMISLDHYGRIRICGLRFFVKGDKGGGLNYRPETLALEPAQLLTVNQKHPAPLPVQTDTVSGGKKNRLISACLFCACSPPQTTAMTTAR